MEAVIGSRGIKDFDFSQLMLTNVISGGAMGIDTLVKAYCNKHNIPLTEIKPDYEKYESHLAPIMRNKEIVQKADIIFAIWDGKSRGTKFVIEYARKMKKNVVVFTITAKNVEQRKTPLGF